MFILCLPYPKLQNKTKYKRPLTFFFFFKRPLTLPGVGLPTLKAGPAPDRVLMHPGVEFLNLGTLTVGLDNFCCRVGGGG